ncbi:hypothetical protein EKO04_000586 [Ascochyta lentis]|uniref:Uncharacterized protein n=1 Tax=Ascochyta lentis TaxID=205686 RepID=A0A8H7JD00_9PLEO|nr:hypothetical protein EKO04_000586 [Ascochyta lentis]
MSFKTYTGPSVADMIGNKTLAENVIKYHNHPTSDSILDDDNLNLLQRFVEDPSNRRRILEDEGIDPDEPMKGQQRLAAYAIWSHGREDANGGFLKESDIELLREWFEGRKAGRE